MRQGGGIKFQSVRATFKIPQAAYCWLWGKIGLWQGLIGLDLEEVPAVNKIYIEETFCFGGDSSFCEILILSS